MAQRSYQRPWGPQVQLDQLQSYCGSQTCLNGSTIISKTLGPTSPVGPAAIVLWISNLSQWLNDHIKDLGAHKSSWTSCNRIVDLKLVSMGQRSYQRPWGPQVQLDQLQSYCGSQTCLNG